MSEIPRGAIRFNTDSNKPELWDGSQWAEFQLSTPNLGRSVDTQPGARGIAFSGNNGSNVNDLNYINISSTGNAVDFGDNSQGTTTAGAACASSTRGIYAGGQNPSVNSTAIEFITIASTGSATAWGANLSEGRDFLTALSNQTRGLWAGGRKSNPATGTTTIDYVTIASSGQTANDFGDLTAAQLFYPMGLASPTRGIIGGGAPDSPSDTGIDVITIATTGSTQDFGTLSNNRGGAGLSNATRGIFAGGYNPSVSSAISYITITSTGNTTNFGDLTRTVRSHAPASSPTRGVFMGGKEPGSSLTIDYIQIQTEGDAVDFGDLIGTARGNIGGCSNAHGGL
jgi:hypothetical protein